MTRSVPALKTCLYYSSEKIASSEEVDGKLTTYCTALVHQFSSDYSRKCFSKEYRKAQNERRVSENEEEAETEAKLTSRLLTTIEAKNHRDLTQARLDKLFEEDVNGEETQLSLESDEESSEINPLMMAEELTLKVVKEKNLYKFQPPSSNIISPNKPIIQLQDLSELKTYFDICINSSTAHASGEALKEYV